MHKLEMQNHNQDLFKIWMKTLPWRYKEHRSTFEQLQKSSYLYA